MIYHKLLNDGCKLLNDGCSLTRLEISVGLDRLADLGTYEGEWIKRDGKWVYMLKVTDAFEANVYDIFDNDDTDTLTEVSDDI